MKKNLISLAVAASVLGGAAVQAGQYVNPDKTGQVLLFPFFNADNGNATNMHIVNTTARTKAVKVRFVEYKNSNEILDFNLYLSPKDHFAFGVIANPNGVGAGIITQDNSCTVPALGSANGAFSGTLTTAASGAITRFQPFVNYVYATAEDVDSSVERTMMGHVEVIEMGRVSNVPASGELNSTQKLTQFASFAKHGATGVPANCAGLSAAWASPIWKAPVGNASTGISAPTGGLYGLAYHINVGAAASFGFEPTAIDDWANPAVIYHTDPGTEFPAINQGVTTSTIHDRVGPVQYAEITNANTPIGVQGAQATAAVLMTQSITNDVMINPAIGGQTDWVVTFPTKKFHVQTTDVVAPFTDYWAGSVGTTTKKEKPACEPVLPGVYDREEQTQVGGLQFSPRLETAAGTICNEVAVITMGPQGTQSSLNVTTGQSFITYPYTEGWMSLNFGNTNATTELTQSMGVDNYDLYGLPAIGFGAYKVNNGAMSYGNTAEHKKASLNVLSAN